MAVLDDGTSSNDDRLGAVGDLRLAIEAAGLESDEVVVLAGDNLFDFSLPGFVEWWRSKPQPASAVPLHDVGDLELAKQYGIADTDAADRIVRFAEKPSEPSSTLASTLIYLLPPEHVQLVETYLDEGMSPDNAGSFLGWLAEREPVYGYRFEGPWYDIGDRDAAARGGQSAAAARRPARARVVQPRLIRHVLATRRGLASEDARPALAAALRGLRLQREAALRRLP